MDDDFEESTHGMLEGTILALAWRVFNQDSTYSGVDPKNISPKYKHLLSIY